MNKNLIYIHLSLIAFFYLCAIFAFFIAPNHPNESKTLRIAYTPPIELLFNWQEKLYFHPYIVHLNRETFEREFTKDFTKVCPIKFFSEGHLFFSLECKQDLNLLGTDKLGRDVFSRFVFGLRPSLFSAILGLCISFPLGIIYGAVAGYLKNSVGELMMRFLEIILSIPSLYILIVLAGLLPPSFSNIQRLLLITVILSLIGWAGLARVVRGQVLSVVDREYVQIAKILGVSHWKILVREIIPQLSSYLIISLTIAFPIYVMGETTLSFLGLGINQPDPSLGNLLAEGRELTNLFTRPWLAVVPSCILMLLAWNCNMLGDRLRNLFDPKSE